MNKLVLILAIFFSFQAEVNSATPSSTDKPISVTELEKFDPNAQVPSLSGYYLRARKIVVAAGGSIAEHSHKTRPGIVYVESGEIIEYRGKNSRRLTAGDSLIEDFSTVHSYKNTTDQDCVLIAFDLPAAE